MFFEFLHLPFQREGFPTKPSILTVNKFFRITPSLFPKRASLPNRSYLLVISFFESLRLPLAKGSSTSHPSPLSSEERDVTAPPVALNRCALRLAGHQSPRQVSYAGWDRLAVGCLGLHYISYQRSRQVVVRDGTAGRRLAKTLVARDGTALLKGCSWATAFGAWKFERRCEILMFEAPLASIIF